MDFFGQVEGVLNFPAWSAANESYRAFRAADASCGGLEDGDVGKELKRFELCYDVACEQEHRVDIVEAIDRFLHFFDDIDDASGDLLFESDGYDQMCFSGADVWEDFAHCTAGGAADDAGSEFVLVVKGVGAFDNDVARF